MSGLGSTPAHPEESEQDANSSSVLVVVFSDYSRASQSKLCKNTGQGLGVGVATWEKKTGIVLNFTLTATF